MALPWRDKKPKITLPVCPFCGAVAKHYGYQCRDNPKNKCSYCGGSDHTSIMCQRKPRRPIRKEAEKTTARRTATSREWFRLNPPDAKGLWYCYLRIAPNCPHKLTRSTITLEHVKSKVRHPELKYDVTNLKPACSPCNKLKGSLDVEELSQLGSVRIVDGGSSNGGLVVSPGLQDVSDTSAESSQASGASGDQQG